MHSNITFEVALLDALYGVTWPNYDEICSKNNADVRFSNSVPVAMSFVASYIFHRYILSTIGAQSIHVCHTAVCVCI